MGPVPPPKYTSTPSSESTASNSVASSTRPKSHLRPERPAISRTDTDALLSYYYQTGSSTSPSRSPATSPVAEPNSPSAHHPTIRLLSGNSSRSSNRHRQRDSESSEYSTASFEEQGQQQERPPAPLRHSPSVLRRSRAPSEKGPDHRRLHIVEMGQIDESATPRLSNKASLRDIGEDIRSRRGMDSGLSLVAPPDVTSSDSYAYPRSPPTAPIISKTISQDKSSVHSRSASEATSSTPTSGKNPREIGIIGMNSASGTSPVPLTPNTQLQPPLFQVPQSRSPSPLVAASQRSSSSERLPSSNRASPAVSSSSPLATPQIPSNIPNITTPEIGQEKDIGAPVAPPVIIPLSSDQIPPATASLSKVSREPSAESSSSMAAQHLPPWVSPPFSPVSTTSSTASSFLYYQPGLHATAGPLPPPPRAIFAIDPDAPPPPRPPRMQSPPPPNASLRAAMKQSLLLPASVEKVLATKKSNKSMRSEHNDQQPSNNPAQSLHKRDIAHSEFADSHSSHEHPVGNHIREGAFPPSTIMTNEPTATEMTTSTSASSPVPEPKIQPSPEIKPRPLDVGDRPSGDSAPSAGLVNPPRSAALPPDSDHGSPPPPVPPAKSSPPRRSRPLSWIGVSPRGSPRASLDSVSSRLSGSSSSRSSSSEIDNTPPNASLRRIASTRSRSPTPSENDYTLTPSTNAANNLKAAFNLKRFSSLPRTPASILSAASRRSSLSSSSGGGGHRRTPSPIYEEEPRQAYEELRFQQPPLEQQERPRPIKPKTKIRAEMPAAMNFNDVLEKKTPGQRAIGYAVKINELWMSDCGLGDWVVLMNERGKNPGRVNKRTTVMPPVPSTASAAAFQHQTRHVSRSSMASEATFPRRPDAYTATDLSVQDGDDFFTSSMPPPPALPYPSLATTPSVARSTPPLSSILSAPSSVRLPSTITTKPSTSFFSLGRKNSVSKRERTGTILGNPVSSVFIDSSSSSVASSRKLLAKSPPAPAPNPRPVQVTSTPPVPGGPRAPPTKVRRSQTMMAMAQPMQMAPSTSSQWSDSGHGGYGSGGGGGYRDRDRDTYRLSTIPLRPTVLGPASSSTSSLVPKSSSAGGGSPGSATYLRPQDPEFARQVDKLADLLPHAERSVLAGYLRRSGQDILAIGQYLEDEKNGTLRRN